MAGRLTAVADMLRDGDEDAMTRFFAQGQPFRDYKARPAASETADGTRDLRIDPAGEWRTALLESARAGEHIVALAEDGTVMRVRTRSAL